MRLKVMQMVIRLKSLHKNSAILGRDLLLVGIQSGLTGAFFY